MKKLLLLGAFALLSACSLAPKETYPYNISEKEWNAILTHMFPLGPVPKNREAWIITMADKICASLELCHIAVALARRNRVVVVSAPV